MGAHETRVIRMKSGRRARIGIAADVEWIRGGTPPSTTITAAIPPVFSDYATVELPGSGAQDDHEWDDDGARGEARARHDRALLALLRAPTDDQPWWLGYLDTGADDIVFPDAPTVTLYADWRYVLVEAGPAEAASWRREDKSSFWGSVLPNLMFPADRSWLVSTLWDDDWTCVGGSAPLVRGLLDDDELGPRARRIVDLHVDATPPGHHAM